MKVNAANISRYRKQWTKRKAMSTNIIKVMLITALVIYTLIVGSAVYDLGLKVLVWFIASNLFTAIFVAASIVVISKAEKASSGMCPVCK